MVEDTKCTLNVDSTTVSKYRSVMYKHVYYIVNYMYDVHPFTFSTWLLLPTLKCSVMKLLLHNGRRPQTPIATISGLFRSTESAMECFG